MFANLYERCAKNKDKFIAFQFQWHQLGLSDTTVLAIYRDILKVSISRCFVRDTMPVHYCH